MQTKQTYIGLYAETSKSIDVPKWQKQNTGNCKSCHALFKHYCSYKYSKVHDLVLLLFQSGALICKSLGPIFLQNWLAQIVSRELSINNNYCISEKTGKKIVLLQGIWVQNFKVVVVSSNFWKNSIIWHLFTLIFNFAQEWLMTHNLSQWVCQF